MEYRLVNKNGCLRELKNQLKQKRRFLSIFSDHQHRGTGLNSMVLIEDHSKHTIRCKQCSKAKCFTLWLSLILYF